MNLSCVMCKRRVPLTRIKRRLSTYGTQNQTKPKFYFSPAWWPKWCNRIVASSIVGSSALYAYGSLGNSKFCAALLPTKKIVWNTQNKSKF